eukprot:CAMPEP_0194118142 /NCGR_PEP_ID=MMETSP0150-20130528/34270_1 /TAXON_ID=122233 /ORGANISM="Chaetoceros debilis, Strain MM31A-1" /LENGTH=582 /DNA_ID=CAMNT_0038809425 /DNA_START=342 /DNA_END=2090 /DNA_ORIENTATION=+
MSPNKENRNIHPNIKQLSIGSNTNKNKITKRLKRNHRLSLGTDKTEPPLSAKKKKVSPRLHLQRSASRRKSYSAIGAPKSASSIYRWDEEEDMRLIEVLQSLDCWNVRNPYVQNVEDRCVRIAGNGRWFPWGEVAKKMQMNNRSAVACKSRWRRRPLQERLRKEIEPDQQYLLYTPSLSTAPSQNDSDLDSAIFASPGVELETNSMPPLPPLPPLPPILDPASNVPELYMPDIMTKSEFDSITNSYLHLPSGPTSSISQTPRSWDSFDFTPLDFREAMTPRDFTNSVAKTLLSLLDDSEDIDKARTTDDIDENHELLRYTRGVPFASKSHESLRIIPSSTGLKYQPQSGKKYRDTEYEYEEEDFCNATRAQTPINSNSNYTSDALFTPYPYPLNNVVKMSADGQMGSNLLNGYSAPMLPMLSLSEYQVYRDSPQSLASTKENDVSRRSEDEHSNMFDRSPMMKGSLDYMANAIPDIKVLDISNDRSTCSFSQVGSTIIPSETTPVTTLTSLISYPPEKYHRQPSRPKVSAISKLEKATIPKSHPASSISKLKPRVQFNDATMMFASDNAMNSDLRRDALDEY